MIYSINYDLNRPGQKYQELYEAIKSLGTWWHYLGSTWLVETNLDADAIWKKLAPHVDQNDSVLVIGVSRDYSGWLSEKAWNWLNRHADVMAA